MKLSVQKENYLTDVRSLRKFSSLRLHSANTVHDVRGSDN